MEKGKKVFKKLTFTVINKITLTFQKEKKQTNYHNELIIFIFQSENNDTTGLTKQEMQCTMPCYNT